DIGGAVVGVPGTGGQQPAEIRGIGHEPRSVVSIRPPPRANRAAAAGPPVETVRWYERNVSVDSHTMAAASASNQPQCASAAPQSGFSASAPRAPSRAQLTGLADATACIQPGIRRFAMNAVDRNVSGSNRKTLSPMMLSRCRSVMPNTLDSALNTVPSSIEVTTRSTGPAGPPG